MRMSDWSSDVCSSDLLGKKTWARLADGTPIVTAERRGGGWLVLVHTTANADWTHLPLRDRKSVVSGKSVSVRVDLGGCRIIKKQKYIPTHTRVTVTI